MYVDNVCPQKTIATPLQKIEKSEMAFEKKKNTIKDLKSLI